MTASEVDCIRGSLKGSSGTAEEHAWARGIQGKLLASGKTSGAGCIRSLSKRCDHTGDGIRESRIVTDDAACSTRASS